MNSQISNQRRAGCDGAVRLHGVVRRIGRWVAKRCGLLVMTPEKVLEWTKYATEYNRIAGDYDLSDARLSGLNYGRCQSLNRCCQDVRELNSPNAEVSDAEPSYGAFDSKL